MNFASIIENDIVDSDDGVCVSLWFSGCDVHCPNCHNSMLWDPNSGTKISNDEIITKLESALYSNGLERSLSVLGGEPLMPANRADCAYILKTLREKHPTLKIRLWTGHIYEDLLSEDDPNLRTIFSVVNTLIDGPFIEAKKDLSIKLRGSSNQRIIQLNQFSQAASSSAESLP